MEAKNYSNLKPEFVSNMEYYSSTDNDFYVLKDEKTILGINKNNTRTIIREDITDHSKPIFTYKETKSNIYTLSLNEEADSLVVGEENKLEGRVIQYELKSGKLVKDYGPVGIGSVISSKNYQNFFIFGGYKSSKIQIIDSIRKVVLQEPFETAIKIIDSLDFCILNPNAPDEQNVLAVAGRQSDYSAGKTDIFDITELIKDSKRRFYESYLFLERENQMLREQIEDLNQRLEKQESEQNYEKKLRDIKRRMEEQAFDHLKQIESKDEDIKNVYDHLTAKLKKQRESFFKGNNELKIKNMSLEKANKILIDKLKKMKDEQIIIENKQINNYNLTASIDFQPKADNLAKSMRSFKKTDLIERESIENKGDQIENCEGEGPKTMKQLNKNENLYLSEEVIESKTVFSMNDFENIEDEESDSKMDSEEQEPEKADEGSAEADVEPIKEEVDGSHFEKANENGADLEEVDANDTETKEVDANGIDTEEAENSEIRGGQGDEDDNENCNSEIYTLMNINMSCMKWYFFSFFNPQS